MSHFIYTEMYKKNAMAQNLGPHFAQTCAVEMHFDILFHGNLQEKCRAQGQPRTQTLTLCQRAQSTCMSTLHKNHFIQKFAGKISQTHTLCGPAKSKCMSTFHKSHFLRKFTGKMPRPRNLGLLGPHFVRACAIEMHFNVS